MRGRRREPGRRVRQHPVRVDVVRRWPKGRKWGLCLHDAVTHTSTIVTSDATANVASTDPSAEFTANACTQRAPNAKPDARPDATADA